MRPLLAAPCAGLLLLLLLLSLLLPLLLLLAHSPSASHWRALSFLAPVDPLPPLWPPSTTAAASRPLPLARPCTSPVLPAARARARRRSVAASLIRGCTGQHSVAAWVSWALGEAKGNGRPLGARRACMERTRWPPHHTPAPRPPATLRPVQLEPTINPVAAERPCTHLPPNAARVGARCPCPTPTPAHPLLAAAEHPSAGAATSILTGPRLPLLLPPHQRVCRCGPLVFCCPLIPECWLLLLGVLEAVYEAYIDLNVVTAVSGVAISTGSAPMRS